MTLGLIAVGPITGGLTLRSSMLLTVTLSFALMISAIPVLTTPVIWPARRRINARRLLSKKRVWAAGKTDALIKRVIPFIAETTVACRGRLSWIGHARLWLIKSPTRLALGFILRQNNPIIMFGVLKQVF